jgi:RNA polymerase primary sigma factor
MARKIQFRTKQANTQSPDSPERKSNAPGFETSEDAIFHQLYDPGCVPLSSDEAESVWKDIDARMDEIRSRLAQFVFVLEEHERVVDLCRTPDDVTSLFVESKLPDAVRGNPPSALPALMKWKSEITAFRKELAAFYAGPQFQKKSVREAMWERSAELLMRYPVSALKVMEWYHVASSWCSTPESPAMDELFRTRLMPDRALCLSVFQTMKAAFERMEQLRQRILYSHLRLVISIAKQSCNQPQQLIDVVQEGNIGLVKALDRFDSSLGHRFSTYATWWIRHEIMRALARQTRVIRIPQHMLATISRINRAEQAYVKRYGTEPTVEDLASILEMPKARIHAIRQMARQQISLQAPLRSNALSDDSDITQEDRFGTPADNDDFNPELHLSFQFLRDVVHKAVDNLPERDRKFIQMRFGLDGYEPMTIRRIAEEFHLSRERVRQIESSVFEKLRRSHPELASHWQDSLY